MEPPSPAPSLVPSSVTKAQLVALVSTGIAGGLLFFISFAAVFLADKMVGIVALILSFACGFLAGQQLRPWLVVPVATWPSVIGGGWFFYRAAREFGLAAAIPWLGIAMAVGISVLFGSLIATGTRFRS